MFRFFDATKCSVRSVLPEAHPLCTTSFFTTPSWTENISGWCGRSETSALDPTSKCPEAINMA